MRLQLRHQGLILVAVPLIFEVVFLFVFFYTLDKAEQQAQQEQKSRQVLEQVNLISKNMMNAPMQLVAWNFNHKSRSLMLFDTTLLEIVNSIDELTKLSADNSFRAEHAKKLSEYGKKALKIMFDHRNRMVGESDRVYTPNFQEFRKDYDKAFDPFLKEAQILLEAEKKEQLVVPEHEAQRKAQLRMYMALGFIANFIAAFIGAIYFSKNITSRLSVLIENSQRMAIGKELLGRIGGADEVAQLDKTFHKMSDALRTAEETKREFVQMISHDLRTPLTAILGTFELLAGGVYGELTERGNSRVVDAERETERLISLINELLDIDKLESGNLQMDLADCELQAVLRRSKDAVSVIAENKKVKIEMTDANPTVEIDADRIVQVLINLLGNAVKYSPEGSQISLNATEEDGSIRIDVIDQGPGIPKKDRRLIFERFKQIEEQEYKRSGSSGLGLAICKSLVEAHNGNIGVDSDPGKGSRFWFTVKKSRI